VTDPNNCRILVVDDSPDVLDTLAMLLRLQGHEVDVASDGREAIQKAVFFTPDVVLLDLGLPWIHGLDVCREIRRRVPSQPMIVAVTGHGRPEDVQRSLEAGCDAHLVKPIDYNQLMKLISSFCSTEEQECDASTA
jgi:DNA-binding response OmpR family regulator